MELSGWMSVLSALGTIAAAGVAAYSARLAWRQVRYQFEPRLMISSAVFDIAMREGSLKAFWWEKPSEEAKYANSTDAPFEFRVRNIGNGAAYNIEIATEFDYQAIYLDCMTKIAPYAPDLEIKYQGDWCVVWLGEQQLGGFRLPDQTYGQVESLDGATGNKREARFGIDPSLSFFTLAYGYFLMKGMGTPEAGKPQSFPVTFRVSYVDSGGVRREVCQCMTLTTRGERFKADFSDGLARVSLSPLH